MCVMYALKSAVNIGNKSYVVYAKAFAAVYLNSVVFWDVKQHRLVKHRNVSTQPTYAAKHPRRRQNLG